MFYSDLFPCFRTMNIFEGVGINDITATSLNSTQTLGTNVSKTVVGTSINLTATTVNTLFGTNKTQLSTSLTIIGRDSGARISVPININKSTT